MSHRDDGLVGARLMNQADDANALAIEWARERLATVDKRARDLPLYVSRDSDPVEALKQIRFYLLGISESANRELIALAVVNLDRVIERLAGFPDVHQV
jgi:hypothetical protein